MRFGAVVFFVCMRVAAAIAAIFRLAPNFFYTGILLNKKHQTTIIIVAVVMQQKVKIAINICVRGYLFFHFAVRNN